MNISKNWLCKYVAIDCGLETLCDKLTMAGIEVEALESSGTIPPGVVAGRILTRTPHPDSDHMSVCTVDVGKETLQIVCGAPNCDAGNVVPVATIGTVFHTPEGEFKIKKSKLRGVESQGMMCSERELGLSDNHDGLMLLDSALELGTPIERLFPGDTRIEIEVTPNRSDWLSMWGVARDVACLLNTEAKLPEIEIPECTIPAPGLVTVEAPDLCLRYTGRLIRNVKVGSSPKWLQTALESVGLRPSNNVVDVTNYVMMELGQPLHAFDLAKLSGRRVVARRAKSGEKITTLDGKTLTLEPRHLVIADAEKPMALAGVMGGEFSGVTDATTDVLLESAVFFASNIRATSRELGISSDSSYRYERGVDWDMAELASKRAAQLILETAGGELGSELVDVNSGRPAEMVIPCRFDRVRALIGTSVSNERIVEIFRALQLKVDQVSATDCVVTAPLFRHDLEREADLIEEVARIDGLDQIPEIAVTGKICASIREDAYLPLETLRNKIIALGFDECLHYSTVNRESALADSRFAEADLIKLKNPISLELAIMRPSLLGEMLGSVERNISRRNLTLKLFEIGKAFCRNSELFPEERFEICMALTGLKYPEQYSDALQEQYDFYDLKGALESLFEMMNIKRYRFVPTEDGRFRKGRALGVEVAGKTAGAFGEISSHLTKGFRTTYPIFVAQIDMATLLIAAHGAGYYEPFSLFPATSRDVAFVAPAGLSHDDVLAFIRKEKPTDLESIQLFDIFEKEGYKSMAYKLTFRNRERTLVDAEVNARFDKLKESMQNKLKVELR
ncbi:MAG: phenylalanine--tRNA ligase subunit beta [Victivallales bacterium]|jgi:phenylalanyl-tRNA synthetase beta chain|nr:phenylalanine--tRNA ligase subunit beta [Victivallales bacterium]